MTTPTADLVARNEQRFELQDGGELTITVGRGTSTGETETIDARPLDISYSGMKLATLQPLVFGEPIELQFHSRDLNIDFVVDADVRWIRQGDSEDSWLIGCVFATQIMRDCVDALANAGGVERRQWDRSDTETTASVQLPGNPNPFRVTVLDYSSAGLRFASADAVEPNQPIRILLDDGHGKPFDVRVLSKWKKSYDSGYLIGCEVSDGNHRSAFDIWRQGISAKKAQQEGHRNLSRLQLCFWGIMSCLSLLALGIWTLVSNFDVAGDHSPLFDAATSVKRPVDEPRLPDVQPAASPDQQSPPDRDRHEKPDEVPPASTDVINSSDNNDEEPFRLWTDKVGERQATARLIEVVEDTAIFEREDGTRVTMSIGRLSEADQDYANARKKVPTSDDDRAGE